MTMTTNAEYFQKTPLFVYSRAIEQILLHVRKISTTAQQAVQVFTLEEREKRKKWQRKQKKAIKNGSYETSESPPKRYYF